MEEYEHSNDPTLRSENRPQMTSDDRQGPGRRKCIQDEKPLLLFFCTFALLLKHNKKLRLRSLS